MGEIKKNKIVVLISADIEWQVIQEIFPGEDLQESPMGEWFLFDHSIIFFHGGWGKISAAASTQYVIGRWRPDLIVNLGTCGGIAGEIEKGEIILVERTIIYDIIEQMGDWDEHIAHYSTELNLSWLDGEFPSLVKRTLMVSGDRDLLVEDIPELRAKFGAVAGDWESGAIAWVASRNGLRCLILRAVTDVVGTDGSPAYGNLDYFIQGTNEVMGTLIDIFFDWLD